MPDITQVSMQLTKKTLEQLEYLRESGFGNRTDIVRLAIDRMYREECLLASRRLDAEHQRQQP